MDLYNQIDQKQLDIWDQEQIKLKEKLITQNQYDWDIEATINYSAPSMGKKNIRYIGGLDISFDKTNVSKACVSLVVLAFPSLEIVYRKFKMIEMTIPYQAGYLAFREVGPMLDMINDLRNDPDNNDLMPDILMIDGNGVLHPRGFGLACHLGVLAGIPTIGVGKNFLLLDGFGLMDVKNLSMEKCPNVGDWVKLIGTSGKCWGASLTVTKGGRRPLYISIGHLIDLETSVQLVIHCSKHRIPEPIRQADLGSREFLRTGQVNQKF